MELGKRTDVSGAPAAHHGRDIRSRLAALREPAPARARKEKSMHAHTVIALAELRHAELLAHAEQLRQTRRAGASRRGRTP